MGTFLFSEFVSFSEILFPFSFFFILSENFCFFSIYDSKPDPDEFHLLLSTVVSTQWFLETELNILCAYINSWLLYSLCKVFDSPAEDYMHFSM